MASALYDDANRLFAGPCTFLRATTAPEQFPPTTLREVAFWGRSNVGKSSLINGLTGRKHLARASKTPGRTQEIIFFDLGGKLMLVDLPGYGHAKAPREELERWNELIRAYLASRSSLRLVCLLIDGRHGALQNDLATMQLLDRAAVSYQVIMTKIDQVSATDRIDRSRQVAAKLEKHSAARAGVLSCSAEKRIGIEELRHFLISYDAPLETKKA